MIQPPTHPTECQRLIALSRANQLDSPASEAFDRITRIIHRALNVPIATISFVDGRRQWFKSVQGLSVRETGRDISFCGHAILSTEAFIVPDASIDPRFHDNPFVVGEPRIRFYAGQPLRTSDNQPIGVLCAIDTRPREWTAQDALLLKDLAALVEAEINASMQSGVQNELLAQLREVSHEAQIDALTRVWNRESIFSLLELEIARAKRGSHGVAVIMVDLDHFKRVNDTHGHAAGDDVLRGAAKRMRSALREVDSLGRYGGEEFLIVLGKCHTPENALSAAERVRATLASAPIQATGKNLDVTASLGVAFIDPADDITDLALSRMADAALYDAKRQGRNRVESAILCMNEPAA